MFSDHKMPSLPQFKYSDLSTKTILPVNKNHYTCLIRQHRDS